MTEKEDYFTAGDHNAACFECGRKFKASEMRKHWQGYYVCSRHWEARHPQDFVRAVPENPTPPWVQPPVANTFTDFCTINGTSCVIGSAVVDCAIIDYFPPSYDPSFDEE